MISQERLAELETKASRWGADTSIGIGGHSPIGTVSEFRAMIRAYRTPTGLDREQVARIIDPDAWDGHGLEMLDDGRTGFEHRDFALSRADKIIALGVVASPEGNSSVAPLPASRSEP